MSGRLSPDPKEDLKLGNELLGQKRWSEAEALFRKAGDRFENKLGRDHETTLHARSRLAIALQWQEKYSEAEEQLQRAVESCETVFGSNDATTLYKKLELGYVLYQQQKYGEAEVMLQQAAEGFEETVSRDDESTLGSKRLLGCALYEQEKYSAAEEVLQQAVEGYERTGLDEDVQDARYWLGKVFFKRKKYKVAEEILQQAVEGYERAGSDEDVQNTRYWLGKVFFKRKKYKVAEEILQQAVEGYERAGSDEDVQNTRYWLGQVFFERKKYIEAEEVLQQALDGDEAIARDARHLLGKIPGREKQKQDDVLPRVVVANERTEKRQWLSRQEQKAERSPQQRLNGVEAGIGEDSQRTVGVENVLRNLSIGAPVPPTTQYPAPKALEARLNDFFPAGNDNRAPYTDLELMEISSLLKHFDPQASKMPRTYVVLRTIGHSNLFTSLIDADFSDYWFPVTERSLPGCLSPSVKALFVRAQSLVLTKSIDLEKGGEGRHCYYKQDEPPPFETKGILGRGGFGQVDRVLSLISFKEYARKQVPRGLAFRGRRKEDVKQFIAEIEILKRLKHEHIVEFVGSYTDPKYISLIMSPVAEMDLGAYLTRPDGCNRPELRTFFGCLAAALEFLHAQHVRHKDIKPGNILVNRGKVLFADFGLSLDFSDANGSTTMSMVNGMTPRYCAPEVAQQGPRNTMSDIWSLGAVFMEMIVVLKGKRAQDMSEFYKKHGSWQAIVCTNHDAFLEFVVELERSGNSVDNRVLDWTKEMLAPKQELRPTASLLVESIIASSQDGIGFIGICCVSSSDDDLSEWTDE